LNKIFFFSDDENDASDDSGTEDPHIVNMDRNKTRAESERQKNRDRFLELEQGLKKFIIIKKKPSNLFNYSR
jgi:hypothetical protein